MPRKKVPLTPKVERERLAKLAAIRASGGVPRDAKGHVLPGHSLNALGRPRLALSELCRQQITKRGLVRVLGEIAARCGKHKDQVSVADQVRAIQLLLTYGYGAPKGEIESGDLKIEVIYADNRQVNLTAAARGTGANHSGVEEIQCGSLRQALGENQVGDGQTDSSGTCG